MTSSRPRLVASAPLGAAALALTLALTGCGSGSSDAPAAAEITDAPAEGSTIEAEGFSYTVPQGWEESDAGGPQALTVAIDGTDDDGFADNVNVVQDDSLTQYDDRDELIAAIRKGLESQGIEGFDSFESVTVDGEEATHTTAVFEVSGMKYRTEQYAVSRGESGYVITFSHNADTEQADRDAVDRSILATWSWD